MIGDSTCPERWITKRELRERLKPQTASDSQLKDWAEAGFIERPRKEFKGRRGTASLYAPDSPERIQLVLEVFEKERNNDSAKVWLWVWLGIYKREELIRAMASLIPGRNASKELELVQPHEISKAVEIVETLRIKCRRDLGESGLPRLLRDRFGSRADANDLIDGMLTQAVGAAVHLGTYPTDSGATLGASIHGLVEQVVAGLGFTCEGVNAESTSRKINEVLSTGVLSIERCYQIVADFDEEDFETMRLILLAVMPSWDATMQLVSEHVGADFAELIDKEFSPNRSARNAVFFLLLCATLADIAEQTITEFVLTLMAYFVRIACSILTC